MLRDKDKNITATLRKVIEPLIAEGVASHAAERNKAEAKPKRDAKKAQNNGL